VQHCFVCREEEGGILAAREKLDLFVSLAVIGFKAERQLAEGRDCCLSGSRMLWLAGPGDLTLNAEPQNDGCRQTQTCGTKRKSFQSETSIHNHTSGKPGPARRQTQTNYQIAR
jgi:hypothetical protein